MICLPFGAFGQETVSDTIAADNDTITAIEWRQAIKEKRFSLDDTTIVYPKFLDFCVKKIRWGIKTFATFDTLYVKPAGEDWKIQLKYNGLVGAYHARMREEGTKLFLNSELSNNAGIRLSYKGFGFEYMPDIDNLLRGRVFDHRKTRITLTTSRFAIYGYYIKSSGTTHIRQFGNFANGKPINFAFEGMSRRVFGIDAYYIFNHKRYAHDAAYGISKIQRRSAGSFLLGFQYSKQKASLDFNQLPDELKEKLDPKTPMNLYFSFEDYAVNVGYSYNWVFHRNWLLNIMASPALGLKWVKNFADKEEYRYTPRLSTNFRGSLGLVYHRRLFFYGLSGSVNGYWYYTPKYKLFANIIDINATIGCTF